MKKLVLLIAAVCSFLSLFSQQDESHWSAIVGDCTDPADSVPLSWPAGAPSHAIWDKPSEFDQFVHDEVIIKSVEVSNGKTLEIKDGVFEFLSQDYSGSYSPLNIEILNGPNVDYYHKNQNYPFEPEHVINVTNVFGNSQGCPSFSLCYGTEDVENPIEPGKRETYSEKMRRLSNVLAALKEAIPKQDAEVYNPKMKELEADTSFGHTLSSYYDVFIVLDRVVNEGDNQYDLNETELFQLDSIANLPSRMNNANSWAKSYLKGYEMHQKEQAERERQDSSSTSVYQLDQNDVQSISVYPNPVDDRLFIILDEKENVNVSLVDLQGREIKKPGMIRNKESIYLGDVAPGTYLLRFSQENQIQTIKVHVR